jgi:hypothetical protein
MCVTLHKYGRCWQLQNDDFIHRRQTRQSRDEEIDNFVSIHKKSSWSGMIIAAKSVYFLSTPPQKCLFPVQSSAAAQVGEWAALSSFGDLLPPRPEWGFTSLLEQPLASAPLGAPTARRPPSRGGKRTPACCA